ncbi:MAG: heavy metal translocating P-type ATPase [Pseudomonadota bacterium]
MTDAAYTEEKAGCPSNLAPAYGASIVDPAPFVRIDEDGEARLELSVKGAKCAGCIAKIEGGVKSVPGVESARLNLSTGKLLVAWRDGALEPKAVTQAVEGLGYAATPFDPEAVKRDGDEEGRRLMRALAVSGFATANVMLLSVAVWAGHEGEMGPGARMLMHWISGAIAVPAALYAGRPFFASAWRALKAGGANMDVPISLAVLLALTMSIYETVNHGAHAYFDAAVMLLFFLLIGRVLDHRLRARARAAAEDLLALQAVAARRIRADGDVEAVTARDLKPGDRIQLQPGDRAPVNGVIERGASDVDAAIVTGESAPVRMGAGDPVYAGVLNVSDTLVLRATASAEDSLVADLARLIEAGAQGKSAYVKLADKAARLYVPVVHTLAALTFLGWFFIGDIGLRASVMTAVAVLIITCPCALGLAAPAVQIVATGRLFKAGVLVKSGDALERLAEGKTFVFDKTGTLTRGAPTIANRASLPDGALEAAARLARASRHPLSRAVAGAAGAGPLAEDVREHSGLGVEGVIDGEQARFGRRAFVSAVADDAPDDGAAASEAWLKVGARPPVRFVFADALRPDAPAAVAALKARGLSVAMLSGDKTAPAAHAAGEVGIEDWRANLQPQDKIDALKAYGAAGPAIMVGDGLNDAPALAAAYASLSPGTAADASQAAADFVFQGEGLGPVVLAYDIAKAARRRILENFGLAVAYNMCAVPLAVAGFVTPLVAAVAMSASSVIVTLNALRLSQARGEGRLS